MNADFFEHRLEDLTTRIGVALESKDFDQARELVEERQQCLRQLADSGEKLEPRVAQALLDAQQEVMAMAQQEADLTQESLHKLRKARRVRHAYRRVVRQELQQEVQRQEVQWQPTKRH